MGLLTRLLLTSMAGLVALGGCTTDPEPVQNVLPDLEAVQAPPESGPVVSQPWDAVGIGTYDPADFARLFTDIGGYTVIDRDGTKLTLRKDGVGPRIVLDKMPASAPMARAADAKSWEPGCYWSLMMRAKNVPSIVADAEALGWLPKTPVAYLEFGPSKLNVVVLTHQKTGMQVQLYERLTTPLPDGYPDFDRIGIPFNIMQMASDRDATFAMFTQQLNFATFYHGEPYLSPEPELMPLGIPVALTTTVPYRASIVSPLDGMETGRFEMIEIMGQEAGLKGRDFTKSCTNDAVGLTEVIYDVPHTRPIFDRLESAGATVIPDKGLVLVAPDGARIRFDHAD